jgi:hypothetical protein
MVKLKMNHKVVLHDTLFEGYGLFL